MAYDHFTDDSPIADHTGPEFVDLAEKNLQALRDAVNTGTVYGWQYTADTGTGTLDEPQYAYYDHDRGDGNTERIRATFTWGTYGATSIVWEYRATEEDSYQNKGTETITYDVDGNATATTWSGVVTAPDFTDTKPVTTGDSALETMDYVRENLMALRDDIGAFMGDHWDYGASGGTAEEPTTIYWERGAGPERINGAVTWSSGKVTQILWQYRPTSATGYSLIGTETINYDGGDNCTSTVWSGTPVHDLFENDRPIISESNANAIITDINKNLHAVREAIILAGMPHWDYSISGGTNEEPQYMFYKNGSFWLRLTNTWGSAGDEDGAVTQQVVEYSGNSGTDYDSIGTIIFAYGTGGVCTDQYWL